MYTKKLCHGAQRTVLFSTQARSLNSPSSSNQNETRDPKRNINKKPQLPILPQQAQQPQQQSRASVPKRRSLSMGRSAQQPGQRAGLSMKRGTATAKKTVVQPHKSPVQQQTSGKLPLVPPVDSSRKLNQIPVGGGLDLVYDGIQTSRRSSDTKRFRLVKHVYQQLKSDIEVIFNGEKSWFRFVGQHLPELADCVATGRAFSVVTGDDWSLTYSRKGIIFKQNYGQQSFVLTKSQLQELQYAAIVLSERANVAQKRIEALQQRTERYLDQQKRYTLQPVVSLKDKSSYQNFGDLSYDVSAQFVFEDGTVVPDGELEKFLRAKGYDTQAILYARKDVEKQRSKLKKSTNKFDVLKACLANNQKNDVIVPDELKQLVKEMYNEKVHELPSTLNPKYQLRGYQVKGFNWVISRLTYSQGCLISDEMGLGKTLQAITAMAYFNEKDKRENKNFKAVVIAPLAVRSQWKSEINKFVPSFKVVNLDSGVNLEDSIQDADIVVTTFGLLRSRFDSFIEIPWSMIIVDEAHRIKNQGTQIARAVKELSSVTDCKRRIAMTGTPLENKLEEIHSIFQYIVPGYLAKSLQEYRNKYVNKIESGDAATLRQLVNQVSVFMLRRRKNDPEIQLQLPDKTEKDILVEMDEQQKRQYDMVVRLGREERNKGKVNVLQLIGRVCACLNHLHQFDSKKFPINTPSAKLECMIDKLSEILESDSSNKVLIFSQYVSMLAIIKENVKQRLGVKCGVYTGQMNDKQRENAVNDFQTNSDSRVMLISLRAGGVGLNLTAANYVMHYDLWWNPAVEAQATDRAHRIGQHRALTVYRFICEGTYEDKINSLLQQKAELSSSVIDGTKVKPTQEELLDAVLGEHTRKSYKPQASGFD